MKVVVFSFNPSPNLIIAQNRYSINVSITQILLFPDLEAELQQANISEPWSV